MKLSDLIIDPGTGMMSHTKIWMHIAYATVTFNFVYTTVTGKHIDLVYWLFYLGVVGGHSLLSKLISMRYRIKD